MPKLLLLAASLLSTLAPLAGWSQARATSSGPRAYAGLALYTSDYQPLGSARQWLSSTRQLPVQARLGYQLAPRWAVQASVAYSYSAQPRHASDTLRLAGPGPYTYYESSGFHSRRNLSVALVGRYRLTRPSPRRLRVEALAGITLEKQWFEREYSRIYFDSNQGYAGFSNALAPEPERATGVLATAGAGGRYRLVPHLEATFDGTANVDFRGNISGLSSSWALGLQATIGQL